MKNKKVLVTGTSGFLGKNLVSMFMGGTNFGVVSLSRKNLKLGETVTHLVYPNLLSVEEEEYINICQKYNIFAIIHCAGISKEMGIPWSVYEQVNVVWPHRLCCVAKRLGIKFIFISSVGVYGTAPRFYPAQESHPYMPDGKYHRSKMLAEQFILSEMADGYSGKNMFILRLNALYGNGDNGVLIKLWKLYKLGILVCNFKAMTSFCSVDLVFEVVKKILNEEVAGPLICNVSEPAISFDSLHKLFSLHCKGKAVDISIFPNIGWVFRLWPWVYNKYALLFMHRVYNIKRLELILDRQISALENIGKYLGYYCGV